MLAGGDFAVGDLFVLCEGGEERAAYGKKVVEALSERLTERYGKGFSVTNLWYFKQFHLAFQD